MQAEGYTSLLSGTHSLAGKRDITNWEVRQGVLVSRTSVPGLEVPACAQGGQALLGADGEGCSLHSTRPARSWPGPMLHLLGLLGTRVLFAGLFI